MTSNYILYVDANAARRQRVTNYLTGANHEVQAAEQMEHVLAGALTNPPRLVLLDIDLEEPLSLKRLRERYNIPLILISLPERPEDEIAGLRMGADDVITKGDHAELVLARIAAALRRSGLAASQDAELIVVGDLVIDASTRRVTVRGENVELSEREFLLLYTLAREAGVVLSREELLERVWGPDFVGEPQTLYVYISWLRKKLGVSIDEGSRIVTVHGLGYKLRPPEGE